MSVNHIALCGISAWPTASRRAMVELIASGRVLVGKDNPEVADMAIASTRYQPHFPPVKMVAAAFNPPTKSGNLCRYRHPQTGQRFTIAQWLRLTPKARAELVRET